MPGSESDFKPGTSMPSRRSDEKERGAQAGNFSFASIFKLLFGSGVVIAGFSIYLAYRSDDALQSIRTDVHNAFETTAKNKAPAETQTGSPRRLEGGFSLANGALHSETIYVSPPRSPIMERIVTDQLEKELKASFLVVDEAHATITLEVIRQDVDDPILGACGGDIAVTKAHLELRATRKSDGAVLYVGPFDVPGAARMTTSSRIAQLAATGNALQNSIIEALNYFNGHPTSQKSECTF